MNLPLLLLCLALPPAEQPTVPRLVAHRGLLRHAPENTLAAFAVCLELRLGFELDVRRSQDGTLVVLHDAELKRTTGAAGTVAGTALAALRKLDAGRWFDPAFAGQRIPTLEEVLALVKARGQADTLLAVDVKIDDGKVEADVVRLAKKHGVLERLVGIGTTIGSKAVRQRFHAADSAMATAVLAQTPADLGKAVEDRTARWVYLRFVPTPEQVRQARAAGKKVLVVGTAVMGRERDNWVKVRQAGADAILTDYPLDCRQIWRDMARKGLRRSE